MKSNVAATLKLLEEIETGLAEVYSYLSRKKNFSGPVKRFWSMMAAEETGHGELFRDIRQRVEKDPEFGLDLDVEEGMLDLFVTRVNRLLRYVQREELSEKDAYKLGAFIEAELDESKYLSKITVPDPSLQARLRRVHSDTSRHRIILVNHSRGIV